MRLKKIQLNELPNREMIKSGTMSLASSNVFITNVFLAVYIQYCTSATLFWWVFLPQLIKYLKGIRVKYKKNILGNMANSKHAQVRVQQIKNRQKIQKSQFKYLYRFGTGYRYQFNFFKTTNVDRKLVTVSIAGLLVFLNYVEKLTKCVINTQRKSGQLKCWSTSTGWCSTGRGP